MISRNPHTLTAAQLYALIRWSPAHYRQYCAATRLATPITSSMTHEARVFAWRFRYKLTDDINFYALLFQVCKRYALQSHGRSL